MKPRACHGSCRQMQDFNAAEIAYCILFINTAFVLWLSLDTIAVGDINVAFVLWLSLDIEVVGIKLGYSSITYTAKCIRTVKRQLSARMFSVGPEGRTVTWKGVVLTIECQHLYQLPRRCYL